MTNQNVQQSAIQAVTALAEVISIHEKKFPVHFVIMSYETKVLYSTANAYMNPKPFKEATHGYTILGKPIAICNDLRLGELKMATIHLDV